MIRCHSALAAALLAVVPLTGRAEVTWICTLAEDAVRLVCIADHDPWREGGVPAPTANVHGTSFPLNPARTYVVELWSPPDDWRNVEQLAQATICYRSTGCTTLSIAPTTLATPAASAGMRGQGRTASAR